MLKSCQALQQHYNHPIYNEEFTNPLECIILKDKSYNKWGSIIMDADETIDKGQNTVQVGEKHLAVNKKGYLINFDDWDEGFAKTMSEKDHLKLTDCHWEAINFLRNFYREYQVPPHPRVVIKAIGDKIGSWGCTRKDLENAFPLGGCKQACRLAGLPFFYCHSC